MRPTAQTLAEFYFKKVPVKTGWLRPDSLAILLSLANISACSRNLVVDGTGGLIAGVTMTNAASSGYSSFTLFLAYVPVGQKKQLCISISLST